MDIAVGRSVISGLVRLRVRQLGICLSVEGMQPCRCVMAIGNRMLHYYAPAL